MPTDSPVPGSTAPQQFIPVSGVTYRQEYGFTVAHLSLTVTINPTALLGASVVAEVSADEGAHWFVWANVGVPAGLTLASANQQIVLLVQSNWLWRVTATRATIVSAMMIGMY